MRGVGRAGSCSHLMLVALVLTVSVYSFSAGAAATSESDLERLLAATRQYPNDPDLAWAFATALRKDGRTQEALALFRANSERWPSWKGACEFEIGRLLYDQGDYGRALEAFETVIYLEPLNGSARLHRALALARLKRVADAERELRVVELIEPELKAESLLLRAMGRMDLGDDTGGQALLREVIAVDPASDAARRASLFMDERPQPEARVPIASTWMRMGAELDSNVTLDSGTNLGGVSTDQADSRAFWGGGILLQAFRGEWGALNLGYNYNESSHEDLKTLNQQSHIVFASLSHNGPGRFSQRLDGNLSSIHLDDDRYLARWLVRPNLFMSINDTWGVSRFYLEFLRRSYHDEPLFSSLDRNGDTYAVGFEHYIPVPGWKGALATLAARLARTDTEASRDFLGFDGDYDHRRAQISTRLLLPLPGPFDMRLSGLVAWERYRNENLIDALTDNGVGTPTPSKRRDLIGDATLALGWAISPALRLELRWQGVRDRSNVDVYDYSRSIVGLVFIGRRSWP